MTTSSVPVGRSAGQQPVEHRDQRLQALEGEALVADVLGVEEALERLGGVEHRQGSTLGGRVEPPGGVGALDALLDPRLLVRLLDEHVLDAERAAVGLAQDALDLPQRCTVVAAQAAGVELAVQVPDGEAVVVELQLGVGGDLGRERVRVRDEVAAHAVHVDEREHAGLLGDQRIHAALREVRVGVAREAHRLVRHGEGGEDLLVEPLLAGEQRGDAAEELGALGPLDDAVVVGAGERQHLADAQVGEGRRGRRAGTRRGSRCSRRR